MQYDVVIVGAGPAGLATAIRLGQLNQQHQQNYQVCLLEKGSNIGAHILSGAILQADTLTELLPHWQKDFPASPVTQEQFLWLTSKRSYVLPTAFSNQANYVISLGRLCHWLGEQAEALDIEIYTGFAATQVMIDHAEQVTGVTTGDMGLDKQGQPTANYQPGVDICAQHTVLAEGCRGFLTQQVIERFQLQSTPQTYALGIKELWEVPQHVPGKVMHTVGFPLDSKTYGGGFLYHLKNQQIALGIIIGLDYHHPYLNPYEELQRFKIHPHIRPLLNGGRCIGYGAKTITEGGFQALPHVVFPGGLLVGESAGLLNTAKLKGIHLAIKSGKIAAETIFSALQAKKAMLREKYTHALQPIFQELKQVRNIRPAFHKSLLPSLMYAGLETYLFKGKVPWTFKHNVDHQSLNLKKDVSSITYPKPDNQITFDKLTALNYANITHDDNQPCHLILSKPHVFITENLELYDAPEQRYCPANVYEIVRPTDKPVYLQINSQNCLHCKTCEIKDPAQTIRWNPPEGGSGPNYGQM